MKTTNLKMMIFLRILAIVAMLGVVVVIAITALRSFGFEIANPLNQNIVEAVKNAKTVTDFSVDTSVNKFPSVRFGTQLNGNKTVPIEWIVLSKNDEEAFLLSKYIIEVGSYCPNDKNATWAQSTIRSFLNNEFYKDSFTELEKSYIIDSKNYNMTHKRNDSTEDIIDEQTDDKVFLLSLDELTKYFNVKDYENDNINIATRCTERIETNISITGDKSWANGNSAYILRDSQVGGYNTSTKDGVKTVKINSRQVLLITSYGLKSFSNLDTKKRGIRPAIKIRLK